MIFLITGTSHTGKTMLAQKLLEKYNFPYLSIDHLKMGLIRSRNTNLTPNDDEELTSYLWPIVKEIIKTAIENNQNLIIEGCYIPFDWEQSFDQTYLKEIKYICLIMSEKYIKEHFNDILKYASVIESRICDDCKLEGLIEDNTKNLSLVKKHHLNYLLIDDKYSVDADIFKKVFNKKA